jgi:hypothetical protein
LIQRLIALRIATSKLSLAGAVLISDRIAKVLVLRDQTAFR